METKEIEQRLDAAQARLIDGVETKPESMDRLADGGRYVAVGSAALIEGRLRREAEAHGGRVARLDLDGWEPGADDLGAFAAYRTAVSGAGEEEAPEIGPGSGARDAARFALRLSLGRPDTEGSAELAEALDELAADGPTILVVPSAHALPESVDQVLAERCVPGSGLSRVDVLPSAAADAEPDLRAPRPDAAGLQGVGPEAAEALDRACGETEGRETEVHENDPVQEKDQVREALARWALLLGTGEGVAPIEPVLGSLGLDEDAREAVIDRIDDHLVEGETLGALRDLQYLHPSFPDAVYGLSRPLWVEVLLHGRSDEERSRGAEKLFGDLRRRLRPSRGAFALLLGLAERSGQADAVKRLRLRLRWWADGESLQPVLERALERGSVTAEELWTLAGEAPWPPEHRLAFLEAWIASADSPERAGDAEMLRAEILHQGERLPEALDAVRKALEIQGLNHGTRSRPYLAALHLCALLLIEAQEIEIGLEQMETCVELAAELLEPGDVKRSTILENHGKALIRGGRLRQARGPFEEALRLTEESRGVDHPATAVQRNNLAGLLLEIGELELARAEIERSAEVFERAFGPRSMELYGALRNLVRVTDELRDEEALFPLLERLAPLEESLLGSGNPGLLSTWTRLAELRRERGDRDGARFLFERALELALEVFYGEHPSIPALEEALSELG